MELQGTRKHVSNPLDTARRLSENWTTSRLQILDDVGHGGGDAFVAAPIEALARSRERVSRPSVRV